MIEPLGDLVDGVLEALASIGPGALAVITGLLLVLETTVLLGLLVPGDVIVLLAGSTARQSGPVRAGAVLGDGRDVPRTGVRVRAGP
jgi:hypothetical protein